MQVRVELTLVMEREQQAVKELELVQLEPRQLLFRVS